MNSFCVCVLCVLCMYVRCVRQALEAVDYSKPPWSTHYAGLAQSFTDHPCVPVHNRIIGNRYCNCSWRPPAARAHGFWDGPNASTVARAWLSVVEDNVEACPT